MPDTGTINVVLTIIGIVVTIGGFINAWMLVGQKNIRDDIAKLRDADNILARQIGADIAKLRDVDNMLTAQIGAIRELVAGQYVTRAEFNAALDRQTATILSAMDRIDVSQRDQRNHPNQGNS